MTHSIRTRLVNWLQSIIDYVGEEPPQVLSRREVQADSAGDIHNASVVGVHNLGPKRQIHNPVFVPAFADYINELNRRAVVPNFPPVGAECNKSSASLYDLQGPLGNAGFSRGVVFDCHEFNSSILKSKNYLNSQSASESIEEAISPNPTEREVP